VHQEETSVPGAAAPGKLPGKYSRPYSKLAESKETKISTWSSCRQTTNENSGTVTISI